MSRVPSFKKQLPELNLETPSLPSGFLIDMLKQEQLLRTSQSSEVIGKLASLYSQAIEYYSSISDPKYVDFTKKLQALLVKPEVQHSLSNPQAKPASAKASSRLEPLISPRNDVAQATKADRFAEKMIAVQKHRGSKYTKTVKESIQQQRELLEKRLRSRTERRATGADSGCTAKTPRRQLIDSDEYERLLERTLEQHLIEKHQRLQYIKSTYSEQISVLQSMPSTSQLQQVISEVQGHLATELKAEEAKLEGRKVQQIAELKQLKR
jgi:hypothetical protein